MKGGSAPRGFTLVETMIFLAVSGMLFFSAAWLINGQQQKAEFNTGVREFQSQLRDVINDVSTGYYPYLPNTGCSVSGSGLSFSGSGTQGSNSDCIYIGRVIQFIPSDATAADREQSYRLFAVAGRRQIGSPVRDVFNLGESGTYVIPNSTTDAVIPYGVRIKWVRYDYNTTPPSAGTSSLGVGFFTNFTRFSTTNANLYEAGARNVDVYRVPNTTVSSMRSQMESNIQSMATTTPLDSNPQNGITMCLQDSSGTWHAFMTVGGNYSQLTSNLDIIRGTCP